MREWAMNITGMAREWVDDMNRIGNTIPVTLPATAEPIGRGVDVAYASVRGGLYTGHYDYTLTEDGFVPTLKRITCDMPPLTPQADTLRNPDARLPMMDQWGFSAHLEAEQRRVEWAEIQAQELPSA